MQSHELDSGAAREFLSRPFEGIDTAALSAEPDLEQLRWTADLPYEVAIYEYDSKWYTFRGTERGIPMFWIPMRAASFIHSHPTFPGEEPSTVAIPSLRDFHNSMVGVTSLIASSAGLTEYFPPEDYNSRREVEREVQAFRQRFNDPSSLPEYLRFLEENGLRFDLHLWTDMTEGKLKDLLYS